MYNSVEGISRRKSISNNCNGCINICIQYRSIMYFSNYSHPNRI